MGLYQDILSQPVRRLALRDLIAVELDAVVGEVIEKMREKRLGCAVAVDGEGKPVGLLTERQISRALIADEPFLDQRLGDYVETDVPTAELDAPIEDVLRLLHEKGTRFVCVTESGKAVALTGQKGIMEFIASYFPKHVQSMVHRVGEQPDTTREGA